MPASGWSKAVTLEDYRPDGETFLWTDLSKGPGQRARLSSAKQLRAYGLMTLWGVTVIVIPAIAAVFSHWAWGWGAVLGAVATLWAISINYAHRRDRLRADIDYGLTPTRLISVDRGNRDVAVVYKGGPAAIHYKPGKPITIWGTDDEDALFVLNDVENPSAAFELITKTLGPTP